MINWSGFRILLKQKFIQTQAKAGLSRQTENSWVCYFFKLLIEQAWEFGPRSESFPQLKEKTSGIGLHHHPHHPFLTATLKIVHFWHFWSSRKPSLMSAVCSVGTPEGFPSDNCNPLALCLHSFIVVRLMHSSKGFQSTITKIYSAEAAL